MGHERRDDRARGVTLRLRPPRTEEYEALTALCLRSKAVHGYDETFMAACAAELTVSRNKLARGPAQVAELDGQPVGYAQVIADAGECWLESLFVEPERIGQGIGERLYAWAREAARELGHRQLVIEADPGAEPFYERMGAERHGEAPSGSIPGRLLPRLVDAF